MVRFLKQFLALAVLLAGGSALAQDSSQIGDTTTVAQEGFVQVEGGKIWYQIVGSGDAIPLLVLHGGPGVPHDYLEPLAGLADERPVVFYDQLGCGKSDRPEDTTLWTMQRFVREVAQVRKALGLDRVHILGHSCGGALAVDYLLTKPEGVASVILAGPLISSIRWIEDQKALLAAFPDSIQRAIERNEAAGTTNSDEYHTAIAEYYARHLCRLDPWPEYGQRAMAARGDAVYAVMWGPSELTVTGNLKDYERADRLKEIDIPTLYTCGRYDETPPETIKWFQSLHPGSEMVIFEQSSHLPHAEETEDYLKTVRAFLKRVENSSKPVK